MRKNYFLTVLLTIGIIVPFFVSAQQVSTFDDLPLEPQSYWTGSDLSGGFLSGSAYFYNNYDTSYGVWNGFAYSDFTDTTSAWYEWQYCAATREGVNGSSNYGIANVPSDWIGGTYDPIPIGVKLQEPLAGSVLKGMYVTNTMYNMHSMTYGDAFSKKFGGESGDDPDWFLLIIRGYNQGEFTDSVNFYLADYRFADNKFDYIINYWAYVDLSPLGSVDSLTFSLRSSDVGDFGMNTPAYFCIDNFNDETNGISDSPAIDFSVYPNPVNSVLNVSGAEGTKITLTDLTGRTLYNGFCNSQVYRFDMSDFSKGIYFVTVSDNTKSITKKIIKK
jgi:hypothetical protein